MTVVALSIQGGHGYAEHGRIMATVDGTTKSLRADGTVTFDVASGAHSIAVEVVVRRPPWATAHGFVEDNLETAHFFLDLQGKQYVIRHPLHPRLVSSQGAMRGGNVLEVKLDYRFVDVTQYFLRGEVYNRRYPDGQGTLSGLDHANLDEKDVGGGLQRRPASLSVHFLEWTTKSGCRIWSVAVPRAPSWTELQDWFVFLVPKGPKTRARSLLDFDFTVPRRYLLDPPAWSPGFLTAPVKNDNMPGLRDFRSALAHEVYLKEPSLPAALLTQVAASVRPTVLVAPIPDDQSDGRYVGVEQGLLLARDLLSLRTALLATMREIHIGGWRGTERFGCAGFSASALIPFHLARKVAEESGPELTLIGCIDPPQFDVVTARAIATWQGTAKRRKVLLVGGDHHENLHDAVRKAGVSLEVHPARQDHYAHDPNPFARAVFVPPAPAPWIAAPLLEASDEEIAAARSGSRPLAVASGSTSDLVGWIRSSGPGRRLLTLQLDEVPVPSSIRKELENLSTMELSGYIGWLRFMTSAPRQPSRDLPAFVRKSSDLRHQWAVASGDVLTEILRRWP